MQNRKSLKLDTPKTRQNGVHGVQNQNKITTIKFTTDSISTLICTH